MSESIPGPFYDAHLHLQDPRLAPHRENIIADLRAAGIRKWVVNGTREDDWDAVADLARAHEEVIPCFGLHPWWSKERRPQWRSRLTALLEEFPHAGVGEIGLDKWIRGHDLDDQRTVFSEQLQIAIEHGRPAMVHCLRCFGTLRDELADLTRPDDFRFLLHSYAGPAEMVADFVELGGYFSFSGYFLEPKKQATREAFLEVPIDRLLIESDAPDMALPSSLQIAHLPADEKGGPVNHPANLPVIYREVAKLRGMDGTPFAEQIAKNFKRFFLGN